MNLIFLLAQRRKYWREKYKSRRWLLRPLSTGRKLLGYRGGQCPGPGVAGDSNDPCRNSPQFLMAMQIKSGFSWQKDSSHQKPGSSVMHTDGPLSHCDGRRKELFSAESSSLYSPLKMGKYCDNPMHLENKLQKFTVLKCRKEYLTLSLAYTQ